MDAEFPVRRRRFVFSVRSLMLFTAAIACALGGYKYFTQPPKADLTITAADVAWAAGYKIWKIDLSNAGPVYGLQIVAFENGGTTKRWLGRIGGQNLLDTLEHPVVTVSAKCDGGTVRGKLRYGGMTPYFESKDLLKGGSWSSTDSPVRDGDLYYLISDSRSVDFRKQPFEKSSNKIALELLRAPTAP